MPPLSSEWSKAEFDTTRIPRKGENAAADIASHDDAKVSLRHEKDDGRSGGICTIS